VRNLAWRLALVAVLACLHIPLLQAIEEQANGPATESTPSGAEPDATANVDGGNSTKNTSDLATPANTPAEKKGVSPAAPGMDEFGRLLGYITLLAALAGAAIYLIKFGIPLHRNRSKDDRKLQVHEMRPLGNRQFLIVVGYEDTRMLLGVTPGKIDYLCPLDSPSSADRDFSRLVDNAENKGSTP
jgi:flagellar biogenesis protein FliO